MEEKSQRDKDMEELTEIIGRTNALLKDRQEGLMSWNMELRMNLEALDKWISRVGIGRYPDL